MTDKRTKQRALWCQAESTFGSDPDGTGANHHWVPALEIGDLVRSQNPIPTMYQTTRGMPTAGVPGRSGAEVTFKVPWIALATAVGDDDSHPADDWLDVLLEHAFGTQAQISGEGLTSWTSGTLTADTDAWDVEDPVLVWETGVPAAQARVMPAQISVDSGGGVYTTVPTEPGTITTAAVGHGSNTYRFDFTSNASMTMVYAEDELQYTLTGGRCTGCKLSMPMGGIISWEFTFSFDAWAATSKTVGTMPTPGTGPATTPLVSLHNPVYFSGTDFGHISSIEVDFGAQAMHVDSVSGTANGRGSAELTGAEPTVEVDPLRIAGHFSDVDAVTSGRLLLQVGKGGAPSPLQAGAVMFSSVEYNKAVVKDDNGIMRTTVTFRVIDPGTNGHLVQVVRG